MSSNQEAISMDWNIALVVIGGITVLIPVFLGVILLVQG